MEKAREVGGRERQSKATRETGLGTREMWERYSEEMDGTGRETDDRRDRQRNQTLRENWGSEGCRRRQRKGEGRAPRCRERTRKRDGDRHRETAGRGRGKSLPCQSHSPLHPRNFTLGWRSPCPGG